MSLGEVEEEVKGKEKEKVSKGVEEEKGRRG